MASKDVEVHQFKVNYKRFSHRSVTNLPIFKSGGDLKEDVTNLLESGDMSDVKFEVEGEIFTAHKLILGARSPVFKAELFGSMSESSMECIKIKDVKPEIFKALLHFVYTDSIGEMGNSFVMMQHLLLVADRYSIDGLMKKCEENLVENVSLGTVLALLTFAEDHNFQKIKKSALEFAVKKDNLLKLAVTKEYCQMGQTYPSLLTEIGEKLNHPVHSCYRPRLFACD